MISTAILLAAGEGTRLRSTAPSKPLCVVGDQPLIAHALEGLAEAGLTQAVVVTGYAAGEVESYLTNRSWALDVNTIRTQDFRKPNGCSVISAAPLIQGQQAVLAMCDHLVDPALYRLAAVGGAGVGIKLVVDRMIEAPDVDLDDVTRVSTDGDRIIAIGKQLPCYDCFDTGVFAVGPALFNVLQELDDPTLTEGVRRLASIGAAHVLNGTGYRWIDVDSPVEFALANEWLRP